MKPYPFAAALLCLGLAACGSKSDFTGTWQGLNTKPGTAITLHIERSGDGFLVKQDIATVIGGGKPSIAHETLVAARKGDTLQVANVLVTLTIDQKTGHLIVPGTGSVTEFEKTS